MACWAWTDTGGANQGLMGVYASGSFQCFRMGLSASDIPEVLALGGSFSTCNPTKGIRLRTWFHMVGVYASAADHRVYLDGGNKGTDTTSQTPAGLNRTSIGIRDESSPVSPWAAGGRGFIVWPAYWNIALSDGEALALAQGCPPWLIRPANLVFCNRGDISGSLLLDASRNRNHMTMQGTLQKFPDLPLVTRLLRKPRWSVIAPPAATAGLRFNAFLNGLSSSGPFFGNPLG